MEDSEFESAVPMVSKFLWAEVEDRKRLQDRGLNVVPANFYSTVPSISEIESSYEYSQSAPPYLGCGLFDQDKLLAELNELIPYASDFVPDKDGNEENCTSFFWKNPHFSFSDAMSYYAYIRRAMPNNVVEIGSGFSSLIAVEALRRNGHGQLYCIEPFPRPFLPKLHEAGALNLHKLPAQDVSAEMLNSLLTDGDILFIDSTHTVKTGSDCLHIYLRLLPKVDKKILVHVHDVFLPFGLPKDWLVEEQKYWTEQYLLLALLIDNPRVRVLFGSNYHRLFNPYRLTALMHMQFGMGGGSFWFEYDGTK